MFRYPPKAGGGIARSVLRGRPVAVKSDGDSLREVHRGHRLQALSVQNHQLALIASTVVPVTHQNAVVLGAGVGVGHERHLADYELVIERRRAAVGYPTDSGLLAKAIGTMARTVARIKAAGGATRTPARDRRRSAGRRARSIASKLRLRGAQQRDQAQAVVRRITGELAGIAEQTMGAATAVMRNAKRALRTATGQRKGRLQRAINTSTPWWDAPSAWWPRPVADWPE
jgi:hypothetical protein